MFTACVFLVSLAGGAVASVVGFGIGSLLTPTLALRVDLKTAVAVVSLPHFIGTTVRFWRLRRHLDRRVLLRFGCASAAGGLTGALLHAFASTPGLAIVFGLLLVSSGIAQLTGLAQQWRFQGWAAWLAGVASGLFGGLVGNQGGIRSAAMLGFDLRKDQFVATATATALAVDASRMPIYVVTEHTQMEAIWPLALTSIAGVVVGTLIGERLLERVPERQFRRLISMAIVMLGVATLLRGHV